MAELSINNITLYGLDIQKKISEISHIMIHTMEQTETSSVKAIMEKAVLGLASLAENPLSDGNTGYDNYAKHREFINDYNSMMKEVEFMEKSLEEHRIKMMMEGAVVSQIYTFNSDCIDEIEKIIDYLSAEAVKIKDSDSDDDGISMNKEIADHIERRIEELRLSQSIARQQLVNIKILQESIANMTSGLQSIIYSTIPLWKDKMLSIMHSNLNDESSYKEFMLATSLLMKSLSTSSEK